MEEQHSPPVFSAVTKTIANLANQRIKSGIEPPCHHLDEAAEAIDAPNPMTNALGPAATPHPCAVAMDLEAPKTSHEAAPTPAKLPPKARHDISRRCRRDVDAGGGDHLHRAKPVSGSTEPARWSASSGQQERTATTRLSGPMARSKEGGHHLKVMPVVPGEPAKADMAVSKEGGYHPPKVDASRWYGSVQLCVRQSQRGR